MRNAEFQPDVCSTSVCRPGPVLLSSIPTPLRPPTCLGPSPESTPRGYLGDPQPGSTPRGRRSRAAKEGQGTVSVWSSQSIDELHDSILARSLSGSCTRPGPDREKVQSQMVHCVVTSATYFYLHVNDRPTMHHGLATLASGRTWTQPHPPPRPSRCRLSPRPASAVPSRK